ncbi:hypothetical protein EG68_12615 [Paragonimus skrjabini miyazakii]|uniref:Exonuclease domain-containing protein n=1 Tax=Paragonimus skrjabini miyazakii TaxID=59628 RepID=A0A8S9YCN0_9TREM|nr:hypothetical protein EG68_12615 [Paragonimus skrjabini miyazakii]
MQKTVQHAAQKVRPSHLIDNVRWYFVLDFESTCSEDKAHVPEIIEFPVVILDSMDGTVVDHFQRFVRPTENSLLTSFCKNLTSVQQVT